MTASWRSFRRSGANIGYKITIPSGWKEIQLFGKTASGFIGALES